MVDSRDSSFAVHFVSNVSLVFSDFQVGNHGDVTVIECRRTLLQSAFGSWKFCENN